MKSILIAILIAFSGVMAWAASDETHTPMLVMWYAPTNSVPGNGTIMSVSNGRYWKLLTRAEKCVWLVGVYDGRVMFATEVGHKTTKSQDGVNLHDTVNGMTATFTVGEVADQIDAFYGDSANVHIPIVEALKFSTLKMKGENPEELQKKMSDLRKNYYALIQQQNEGKLDW
jgi:hypothetical protein